MSALRQRLHDDGLAWWRGGWPADRCAELAAHLDHLPPGHAGSRRLLAQPAVGRVADALRHALVAEGVLGDARTVQCTLFEKRAGSNWAVALHQDLSIPVAQRHPATGWQGWSVKEGALFAQPPVGVLHTLLAARLRLDPCAEPDGALRLVPGSHTQGVIAPPKPQPCAALWSRALPRPAMCC